MTLKEAVQKKGGDVRSRGHALNWFRAKIRQSFTGKIQYKDNFSVVPPSQAGLGRMYFFIYDPKLKETLPYYDAFPLVVIISKYSDGFLGLNLHYLPPKMRAAFLDQLMTTTTGSGGRNARMVVDWERVKAIAKVPGFEKCVHRYLTTHLRSPLVKVAESEWEEAALLPVKDFEKSSATQIWRRKR